MKNLFYTFRFMKAVIFVIKYLIRNKGNINIVMQKDEFNKNYHVYKDDMDFIVQTTLKDFIGDIYCCNK